MAIGALHPAESRIRCVLNNAGSQIGTEETGNSWLPGHFAVTMGSCTSTRVLLPASLRCTSNTPVKSWTRLVSRRSSA
jgi:hypothetical protein